MVPKTIRNPLPERQNRKRKIAIITTCIDEWGGCEDLWAKSIPLLQANGFAVTVYKERINRRHPEYIKLLSMGVELEELSPVVSRFRHVMKKIGGECRRLYAQWNLPVFKTYALDPFARKIKSWAPDLVVIAQGINFDGAYFAHQCASLNIPYAIISQKAVDFYWPPPKIRASMTAAFQKAAQCFFVSQHNKRLTEEQFGTRLPNSQVVYNPVKVPAKPLPFPSTENGYRLACVGRLFLLDKGQDILLRILSQEKWKERPVSVSFIGTGMDEEGLRSFAAMLNVSNVEFIGFVDDVEELWRHYHAFILPSRSEGLPLALVEAMAAGRPVIVSRAGGNAELVQDGVTGFLGTADEASFDQTMEYAWSCRENWEQMGKKASAYVAAHVPKSPESEFSNMLMNLVNEN